MRKKIKEMSLRSINFFLSCRYILLLGIIILFFNINIVLNKDYGSDFTAYFVPHYHFITNQLKEGVIPFWFPYNFGGLPEIFKSELAIFNPFVIFWLASNIVLNNGSDMSMTGNIGEIVLIAEQIFAAAGFYLLVSKEFSINKIAALTGAIIYVLNPNMSHLINTSAYLGIAILPWIIWAILRYLQLDNKLNFLFVIITNLFLFTGGYPYHYIYFLLVQIIIVLCINPRKIFRFLLPYSIAVLLGAFILLPNFHVYTQSSRSQGIIDHSQYSMKPSKIIQLINPSPSNSTYSTADKSDLISYPHFAFGTVMVILALIGIFGKPEYKNYYWVVVSLFVFVIYSISGYINAIDLFSAVIPFIAKFRSHAQGIVIINLCLSIFATYGMHLLRTSFNIDWQKIKISLWVFMGISLIFTIFYLLNQNSDNQMILYSWSRNILFLLLIAFILFLSRYVNTKFSILLIALFLIESYFLYSINPHIADYRYSDFYSENNLILEDMKKPLTRIYVEGNQFQYNLAHLGISQDVGYEALPYKSWHDFSTKHYGSQRLGKRNVEYVISSKSNLNLDDPHMEKLNTYSKAQLGGASISDFNGLPYFSINSTNSYSVYKINNTTPRYFAPTEVKSCLHKSCINEDSFPNTVVYNGKQSFTNGEVDLNVTAIEYSPNKVSLNITSNKNAYIASSDIYDKGWKATVNNAPTQIYLTSGAYRGIFINEGENLVEFRYYPPLLNLGIGISVVALILILLLLFTDLLLILKKLDDKLLLYINSKVDYVKKIKPI